MSDHLALANDLKAQPASLATAGLADGVYFGLPAADYHRDPALGSSGVRDLMVSPLRFWINSPFNPEREFDDDDSTDAKDLGSYLHDLLLEGGTKHYAIKPEGMSFATKDGKAWREDHADFTIITQAQHRTQQTMFRALETTGVIGRFTGGEPEVSVFWTEKGGQRCKIRIDYLKADEAIDLKTYSNSMDKDTETAVAHTIAARRISVQAFWYDRGISMMRKMLAGSGWDWVRMADGADERSISNLTNGILRAAGEFPLWFVFCETGKYPNITARRFESHDDGELNAYYRWARMGVEFATQRYATCMAKFGPSEPWVEPVHFKAFVDEDFASASWILAKD